MKRTLAIPLLLLPLLALPATAALRVVHASPDAPNVDVIVNNDFNNPVFRNLPFEGVTSYVSVPSGNYNFKVVPTGQKQPVVIDVNVTIDENLDYTIAATNLLAKITPKVYVDTNTLSGSKASVRFIHLSPDAPAVDIALAKGGPVLFGDVEFGEAADYGALPPGTYDLEARVAGTNVVALNIPGVKLEANRVYTAYAMGLLGGNPPLQAVLSVDAQAAAQVRVVHASPDAPAVDVVVNDDFNNRAVVDLAFTKITGYLSLPAAEYNFKVVPTGQKDPVVIDADVELEVATTYTVVAADLLSKITPLVFVDDNTTLNTQARARFIHLSPDAPPVDIRVKNGPKLWQNVSFKQSGGYISADPGTYDFEVLVAGTNQVVLTVAGVKLDAQSVYTIYAMGTVNSSALTLQAILSVDVEGPGQVRVVHASPNAPSVDLIVNDDFENRAVVDLMFTEITGYLSLPADTYNFKVVPTGQKDPVVIDADVPLDIGLDYTVVAADFLAKITPLVFVDDNRLIDDRARARFIHLSPDAPAVDVRLKDGAKLWSNVSFKESGGYIEVPGGFYDLEVTIAGTNQVVLSIEDLALANNTAYTAYAMGTVNTPAATLQAILSTDAQAFNKGDVDCDGFIHFSDINAFVLALSNPQVYRVTYPDCDLNLADVNGDGQINFADINPLVELLGR